LSFFIVHTPPPAFSILSLHDALPISGAYDVTPDSYPILDRVGPEGLFVAVGFSGHGFKLSPEVGRLVAEQVATGRRPEPLEPLRDRKSTRLNSSHEWISYAVFCLKKK